MLVFAFRNIVLAALIAVGPVAWMLYPARAVGPQWVVRYVSAVVVLLLTGPLTIGFVTLIINGLANVRTIWDPQVVASADRAGAGGIRTVRLFGLFSFVGAVAADSVGSRVGSKGGERRVERRAFRGAHPEPDRRAPRRGPTRRGAVGGAARRRRVVGRPASAVPRVPPALGVIGPFIKSVDSRRAPIGTAPPKHRRRGCTLPAYGKDRHDDDPGSSRPVRLPRRSRQGVVMGMDGWQLTCIAIAAAVLAGVNRSARLDCCTRARSTCRSGFSRSSRSTATRHRSRLDCG